MPLWPRGDEYVDLDPFCRCGTRLVLGKDRPEGVVILGGRGAGESSLSDKSVKSIAAPFWSAAMGPASGRYAPASGRWIELPSN